MYLKPLFLLLLLTGLATAGLHAQLKPGDRPVTVHAKNIRAMNLFRIIREQTGMHAFYSELALIPDEILEASFDRTPLDTVLSEILGKKGFSWKYYEEIFVIIADEHNYSEPAEYIITGGVTDTLGNPIPGATILIKATGKRAISDDNGKFMIAVEGRKNSLTISHTAYKAREVIVLKDEAPTIKLMEETQKLDEAVVIAYGTSTQRKLTGTVSKVTAKEIVQQATVDPLLALQGRAPGLNITQLSGLPGGEVSVELRGQASITAGNRPLYIVDGIPFPSLALSYNAMEPIPPIGPLGTSNPLTMFNIADIQSVEILKDADATAIYGSRGANGVILISTKKAATGKMKLEAGIYTGVGRVARHQRFLNTEQYLQMRHEALRNDGVAPQKDTDHDLLSWDTTRYTNWEKEMLGGRAYISDAQLAIEGGDSTSAFRISGGYHNETTVYPGSFGYKKMSARAYYSLSSDNKRARATFTTLYVNQKNKLPPIDLSVYSSLAPDAPAPYNSDGTLNWEHNTFDNPMGDLGRPYKLSSDNLVITSSLSYKLLPNLVLKTDAAYNKVEMDEVQINPWYTFNPGAGYGSSVGGYSRFSDGKMTDWIIEPQAEYQLNIKGGTLQTLLGATFQQDIRDQKALYAGGFTSNDHLERIEAAYIIERLASFSYVYRYSAIFGRINYNWKEKYIANLNIRRDGSSRFAPGNRFATFGSIGGAWTFSKEPWIQRVFPALSFGKLRASYGITGNDQISDYGYYSTYSYSSLSYGQQVNWFPSRLGAPDYGWELNKKLEFGLDLGLMHDKILFKVCHYRHRSTNQLIDRALPGTTGFGSVYANFDAEVSNTGIELELNTTNIQRRTFNWNTSINLSIPQNKLVFLGNLESTSYNANLMVGNPLKTIVGLQYTGVDPLTGTYSFVGVDTSGKPPAAAVNYPKRIGTLLYGGLQNHLELKNWQLDVLFYFVKQNRYNYLYIDAVPGTALVNQPVEVWDRWTATSDRKPFQRFTQGADLAYRAYSNIQKSDAVITDASFLRLRTLCLAYRLPQQWLSRLRLQNVRCYVQGQNLLTITAYGGRDPEVATSRHVYPPLRWWILGVQLNL